MAWTSMHFAVGMGCAGALCGAACLYLRRGWRWLPFTMTLGGFWAIIPDAPRLWREDFTGLPWASTLGAKSLERDLHSIGDLFFFHKMLDAQPHELALHGLILMLVFYNAAIAMLMWSNKRPRHQTASGSRSATSDGATLKFEGRAIRSSHLQRTG